MLNTIYRLIEPRKIEVEFNELDLSKDNVIVRPTHLSICNADQRYYQGKRDPEALAKKLPMALIHEGIGTVVYDGKGQFKEGQTVVMIPNTPVEKDSVIAENYLRSSKFRASGFDGFMQDNVAMDRDRLVELPEEIDKNVAAFIEIISVSHHAINRFESLSHGRKEHIAVWGDGNLAFITALQLRYKYPDAKLYVMGLVREKLSEFTFTDETYHIREIPEDIVIDHAFECVGGEGSPKAINQIIDYIKPEATISILGVSENPVPINTRMILEKGLRVFGSSRSGRKDFQDTVDMLTQHPEMVEHLKNIVGDVVLVKSIEDMHTAFEKDISKAYGKTIMLWNV
ncbi:MAG: ribitol-5-phosphate dehydrogenase [Bacillota bacterium]|nr:ribitol-5-phosphate dehydrogenase [Bacillota bacterium]